MIDTKKCGKCGKTKHLDEFAWSSRAANKKQPYCRECSNKLGRQNYQDNKERYFLQAKKRDKEMRDWLNEQKSVPCVDCAGVFDPICMDFDHLPEHDKVMDISKMRRRRMAWDKIKAEVAKCEVVCSNCHRLRSKQRWEAVGTEPPIEGDF